MTPYASGRRWVLWAGDCLDVLSVLSPVDVAIMDAPYSEHTHNKSRVGANVTNGVGGICRVKEFGFDALADDVREGVATHVGRLVRRWVLAFSDLEMIHLWRADLEGAGLDYVRTGVWVKEGCTPQFSGDRPANGAEAVTICHPPGRKRWNGGGGRAVWSCCIVRADAAEGRYHTTQKPLALMRELVRLFSDEGETILDPFAGSGSTGVAALLEGRSFIGIEREPTYLDIAARRLSQAEHDGVQSPLFAAGA